MLKNKNTPQLEVSPGKIRANIHMIFHSQSSLEHSTRRRSETLKTNTWFDISG